MIGAAKMGMDFRTVSPKGLQPEKALVSTALSIAEETGAKITVTEDIDRGVKGCDFLCTDVVAPFGICDEQNNLTDNNTDYLPLYDHTKLLFQ